MDMQNQMSHIGDILAIPFFALLTLYFFNKVKKTLLEWILFAFSATGLIADILFTLQWLPTEAHLAKLSKS